jgi:hypothetical protein
VLRGLINVCQYRFLLKTEALQDLAKICERDQKYHQNLTFWVEHSSSQFFLR